MLLADTCITHPHPHQLNLILSIAALNPSTSSASIISSLQPPLLHRAATQPVFSPSILCTVLAHHDDVNIADSSGECVCVLCVCAACELAAPAPHWHFEETKPDTLPTTQETLLWLVSAQLACLKWRCSSWIS